MLLYLINSNDHTISSSQVRDWKWLVKLDYLLDDQLQHKNPTWWGKISILAKTSIFEFTNLIYHLYANVLLKYILRYHLSIIEKILNRLWDLSEKSKVLQFLDSPSNKQQKVRPRHPLNFTNIFRRLSWELFTNFTGVLVLSMHVAWEGWWGLLTIVMQLCDIRLFPWSKSATEAMF